MIFIREIRARPQQRMIMFPSIYDPVGCFFFFLSFPSISPRLKFILIILNNAKNNTSSRLNLPPVSFPLGAARTKNDPEIMFWRSGGFVWLWGVFRFIAFRGKWNRIGGQRFASLPSPSTCFPENSPRPYYYYLIFPCAPFSIHISLRGSRRRRAPKWTEEQRKAS